jgi:nitrogen PTS system EIIA component
VDLSPVEISARVRAGPGPPLMKIADFVREELIVADLRADQKQGVLRELADHVAGLTEGLSPAGVLKVLEERERLASTAIGEGVAIPHGKLEAVRNLVACVGRSRQGVAFESMDGRPTHIFFVLLAPTNPGATGTHLKALARISRLFKDGEFRTRLLEAPDAHSMFEVIQREDAKY